jgi:hypothetical protein
MNRWKLFAIVLTVALASGGALADNLTGARQFLCSAVLTTACTPEDECMSETPWKLNIPRFIEIDLDKQELRTTQASQENRKTPIKHIRNDDGLIVLQGYEAGRAFSLMIDEESGKLTAAVARDDLGVVVFGACTPLPTSR